MDNDKAFAKLRPTVKHTIRRGPAVAATASISLIFILLCIYSGNRNSKNIIQHLGIVFKEINIVIKFSINLILINFFIRA